MHLIQLSGISICVIICRVGFKPNRARIRASLDSNSNIKQPALMVNNNVGEKKESQENKSSSELFEKKSFSIVMLMSP